MINLATYSPDPTGQQDSTTAFKAALAAVKAQGHATSPCGNNWGHGHLHIPKGKYLITETLDFSNAFGLKVTGEGQYATSIITTSDSMDLIKMGKYVSVSFEDMTFSHCPTSSDRSLWSNSLFTFDSGSGGANDDAFYELPIAPDLLVREGLFFTVKVKDDFDSSKPEILGARIYIDHMSI